MWELVQETVNFLKNKTNFNPTFGIVLGSGLGNFIHEIDVRHSIPYNEIPNFPVSTVLGHKGALVFGFIGDKPIVAMQGRFHYYEGYSMQQVTFPIRVMKGLGVENLIVSNASGGVNPNFEVGSIMIINDHINFMSEHPLRGKNDERFGPRFVDMNEPYNKGLIQKAHKIATSHNIQLFEGVYLGLQGPTFETLAEYRMIRILGADCVGMSTVPEVIVAKHMEMDVFGISIITDMGTGDVLEKVSHDAVLKAAKQAEPKVGIIIKELIKND